MADYGVETAVDCADGPLDNGPSSSSSSGRVCRLPGPHLEPRRVEQPGEVGLARVRARLGAERTPQRRIHLEDGEVRRRVGGCDVVGAEEESVRVPVDQGRRPLDRLRRGDDVLRDLVPRDVEVDVSHGRILEDALGDPEVALAALRRAGTTGALRLRGMHDASEAYVRPDD